MPNKKGRCPVAEQLFGMCNIPIHTTVFELSLTEKDRKKMNKIEHVDFSRLIKVSGTYTKDLAIEQPRDVVYKHFAFICFVFHGAAPILNVQVAILNLPQRYS